MLIRCTSKLIKEIGLSKADLSEGKEDNSSLGEWYANLFYVQRKKCVIFVNARTFFCAISFDVNRAQIKNLGELFRTALGLAMLYENIAGSVIQDVINQAREIHFLNTCDKVVIGTMIEYVKVVKWIIEDGGTRGIGDQSHIVKELNCTPHVKQKFYSSAEELKRVLNVT